MDEGVAFRTATVLIGRETGTGKELIARAHSQASKRASRAFIGVNCAAFPPSLIASELLAMKGSLHWRDTTSLGSLRVGEWRNPFSGTEVGDLPLDIQIALLRVLQGARNPTRRR